jgi:Bacterial SH3 domain
MAERLQLAALLVAFAVPFSAVSAHQDTAVKCSPNEDRVWVYDSPTSFNVEQKLKCGTTVSIIGQQHSFVKIQTDDGTEGYVPSENIPQAGTQAAAPQATTPAQPVEVRMPRGSEPRISTVRHASAAGTGPTTSRSVAIVATSPTRQPQAAPDVSAAAGPEPRTPNSVAPGAQAPESRAIEEVSSAPSPSKSADPAARPAPQAASRAPASPVPEPSVTAATSNVSAERGPAPAGSDDESDDPSWVTVPRYESDDPACKLFFSSYGLSPGQFRWIVENRKKRFPSVCPAASPAMVDYVIIFTHDVNFYSYTMPAPVHVDGGFSDFNPIALSDENVPRSEIDKSKREYVWVFHVQRGTYNPARFSPHRRFQFSKIGSKYSQTIEDAFRFIETRGVDR